VRVFVFFFVRIACFLPPEEEEEDGTNDNFYFFYWFGRQVASCSLFLVSFSSFEV
jgi:hypothetical protein